MTEKPIAIAADHAGFELKAVLSEALEAAGHTVLDLGTYGPESVDYPDFGVALAQVVELGKVDRGVLVCGSGIGISIAANRNPSVRAALCHDETTARLAREHNDANVLALGARTTGVDVAKACLEIFLATEFAGGERHERRVAKLG
ncbi:ribose 5-phosphate isomerase B [Denitrobaculum tricleocarpae]|uniref:Ribose 5-phosphate isomerase B n=1 Tax=Denitrobaculum tricleocarpae TaxID=2591009 RepID=A0A545TTL0_9PROT|nr:ribose 5-phosphate isomerase B [Denitrobaculum tricleocarpae]TQV80491.1 ribose 5-phosphate isomerase B [Denitrobaculum tricleocarpae]